LFHVHAAGSAWLAALPHNVPFPYRQSDNLKIMKFINNCGQWYVILKSNESRVLTGIKRLYCSEQEMVFQLKKSISPCSLLNTAILKHGNQNTSNYSTIYLDGAFQFVKHRMTLREQVKNCDGREENGRSILEDLINS
jgi:hypothetical protein